MSNNSADTCNECHKQVKSFLDFINKQHILSWLSYSVKYNSTPLQENPQKHGDKIENVYFEYVEYKERKHFFTADSLEFTGVKRFQVPACKSFNEFSQSMLRLTHMRWLGPEINPRTGSYSINFNGHYGTQNPQITYF